MCGTTRPYALENIVGPIAILNNVHPDKSVRDAADAAMRDIASVPRPSSFRTRRSSRASRRSSRYASAAQLKKDLIEAFEDSGVALPRGRASARANLGAADRAQPGVRAQHPRQHDALTFTPAEMRGPAAGLSRARPAGRNRNIVVGFDYPDFNPFMANARDEAARQRYYVAYLNRGTPEMSRSSTRSSRCARELAGLLPIYPSYAHYVTRRRMAGNPGAVLEFLDGGPRRRP